MRRSLDPPAEKQPCLHVQSRAQKNGCKKEKKGKNILAKSVHLHAILRILLFMLMRVIVANNSDHAWFFLRLFSENIMFSHLKLNPSPHQFPARIYNCEKTIIKILIWATFGLKNFINSRTWTISFFEIAKISKRQRRKEHVCVC